MPTDLDVLLMHNRLLTASEWLVFVPLALSVLYLTHRLYWAWHSAHP